MNTINPSINPKKIITLHLPCRFSFLPNCNTNTINMKNILLIFLFSVFTFSAIAQVNYTANNQVTPYAGFFRPGINLGYYPPYDDADLGNIAAGNPTLGISGIGARATRPGFSDWYTTYYGFDTHVDIFKNYQQLGMKDLTCIVGFPADEHRDTKSYCSDGTRSEMFANLYTPIWDNGANGTPYNDENYLAAYMYKLVTSYKDYVKFWEIWNEPGFDHSGDLGWRPKGSPGNWFDNDPDPCANHTKAPVQHFIRTLRICYDIIKTIDPDAYVALSGVGYESFLDAVLRNTDNPDAGQVTSEYPLKGGAYFDVMGFHTYPDIDGSVKKWNPSTSDWDYNRNSDAAAQGIVHRKRTYENRLAQYGYDGNTYPKKEWICTEMNAPRVKFDEKSMASEASQINYIIKGIVNAMKIHLRQIHPYQLADTKKIPEARDEFDLMGMYLNMEDTQPYQQLVKTKEGIAYKTVSDFVFGTRFNPVKTTAMSLPNTLDGIALYDEAKKHFKYIIWAKTTADLSEEATGVYNFPSNFGIVSLKKQNWNFSETQQQEDLNPSMIQLSGRPIFLEENEVNTVSVLTVHCPNNIEVTLPKGENQIPVEWPNIGASTTCPNFLINFEQLEGPSSGSVFTEGVHTITFKISDSCENQDTCSFTVTVNPPDTEELTVHCHEDIHATIPINASTVNVNWDAPTATTTCPNSQIMISQQAGFPSGTAFHEGEYTVSYKIKDDCNEAYCDFKIYVTKSTIQGEISMNCPSDMDVTIHTLDTSIVVTWEEPTASSTCPASNIQITQIQGLPSGSAFPIGEHAITYQFIDDCDQKTCNFTIKVIQNISGELSVDCPDDMEFLIPKGNDSTIVITWDEPVVQSSCASSNIVLNQTKGLPSGSAFSIGAHTIEYHFKDACDEKTCSFLITVTKATAVRGITLSQIKLTPNPAHHYIAIQLNSSTFQNHHLKIFNIHGQLIQSETMNFYLGNNIKKINLESLPNGVYFLKIENMVFRFVKM